MPYFKDPILNNFVQLIELDHPRRTEITEDFVYHGYPISEETQDSDNGWAIRRTDLNTLNVTWRGNTLYKQFTWDSTNPFGE